MFCEQCGNKIESSHKFCTKCGRSKVGEVGDNEAGQPVLSVSKDGWWQRLLKVAYILLYIPLLFIIPLAWSLNSSSYDYYTNTRTDTAGSAFVYSAITLIIYMAVVRLIKIEVLYVAMGQRPDWGVEFKKYF